MVTKFNLGDRVQIKDSFHYYTIKSIHIDTFGLSYFVHENMGSYSEHELKLYVEPKIKKYKYVFNNIYIQIMVQLFHLIGMKMTMSLKNVILL